jgi:hypothetical protein
VFLGGLVLAGEDWVGDGVRPDAVPVAASARAPSQSRTGARGGRRRGDSLGDARHGLHARRPELELVLQRVMRGPAGLRDREVVVPPAQSRDGGAGTVERVGQLLPLRADAPREASPSSNVSAAARGGSDRPAASVSTDSGTTVASRSMTASWRSKPRRPASGAAG